MAKVLVVDDDLPIRTLIMRTLERAGYKTEGAEDGSQAIEKLKGHDYGLVLLDMMMPRVDGFGVLDYMSENAPETLKKTIIASAMPIQELRHRLHYEVCQVLGKPFDIDQLLHWARVCLSGETAQSGTE